MAPSSSVTIRIGRTRGSEPNTSASLLEPPGCLDQARETLRGRAREALADQIEVLRLVRQTGKLAAPVLDHAFSLARQVVATAAD